jgi:hypothetical protein
VTEDPARGCGLLGVAILDYRPGRDRAAADPPRWHHVTILDLFAECFEYVFAKDAEWAAIRNDVGRQAEALANHYEKARSEGGRA